MQARVEVQQKMFSLIEAWRDSGLSQKQFCSNHGISYHVFHYWYKRFKNVQINQQPSSSFIALDMQPAGLVHSELIMPNGKRLLFYHAADERLLLQLLQ